MSNQTSINFQVVLDMVEPKSRVLDLGCGDGGLLGLLAEQKSCHGTGIEINEQLVYEAMAKGVAVSHGDIDSSLEDYSSNRFDYVILNESLQQVIFPKKIILEALRVAKKVIVGIPNFCNSRARFQIFFEGRVPMTKDLPYEWYDTPNLRFLSLKDFRHFCQEYTIDILKQVGIKKNKIVRFKPNFTANTGIFLLEKKD